MTTCRRFSVTSRGFTLLEQDRLGSTAAGHTDKAVRKASSQDEPRDDPRPTPPRPPELEDCCRSGCSQCVFDLYDEALERYEAALDAWEARHARAKARC
jgi:Oxidoreductase-like protein, N-terminal